MPQQGEISTGVKEKDANNLPAALEPSPLSWRGQVFYGVTNQLEPPDLHNLSLHISFRRQRLSFVKEEGGQARQRAILKSHSHLVAHIF